MQGFFVYCAKTPSKLRELRCKRQKTYSGVASKTASIAEICRRSLLSLKTYCITVCNEVEYSLFTQGNKPLIIKRDGTHTQITQDMAQSMAADGWRWSGHTHRGNDNFYDLQASSGDLLILKAFGQKRSVIYNSNGAYLIFEVET